MAFDDAPRSFVSDAAERAAHPYWGVFEQVSREMRPEDEDVLDHDDGGPRTFMDDLHDMAGKILSHRPTTRAGLRLQVLALTSSWCEVWEGGERNTGTARFLASAAAFCDVPFPPYEVSRSDEDDDGDEDDDADPIFAAIARHRAYAKLCENRPDTSDLVGDAAIALINVEITTHAGAEALTAYAAELEGRGIELPDVTDEHDGTHSWTWFMQQSVAEAVAA